MKKLIVSFALLFIVCLFARILFAYYVDRVPVFSVLITPLTWLCVVFGVLCALFIIITIVKEIRSKSKGDE